MKKLILTAAALALTGCFDHNPFDKQEQVQEPKPDQTIGKGQILKAHGIAVMVGAASYRGGNNGGYASIPYYVLDAPPFNYKSKAAAPALSCLFLDNKGGLVATVGGIIPPQLHGGTMQTALDRYTTATKLQCQIGTTDPANDGE